MQIKTFQGGFDKNLSYLIWCKKTRKAAIIDPSVEVPNIIETINKYNLLLNKILITHTHHDHIYYIEDFLYMYPNAQILCSNETSSVNFQFYGVAHNEVISIGEELLTCLKTPGHYYNSICFYNKKNLSIFTGDTMFVGRSGRTIDKKSNIKDLYNSIYKILLLLPHNTRVFPGHHYGYKKSITINDNIICSKFFQCNSFAEFIKIMRNFEKNR